MSTVASTCRATGNGWRIKDAFRGLGVACALIYELAIDGVIDTAVTVKAAIKPPDQMRTEAAQRTLAATQCR